MALEREFSGQTAIVVTAITFAVLPHPPAHAALLAKWLFFFLTGLTFSTMAYFTSILDAYRPAAIFSVFAYWAFRRLGQVSARVDPMIALRAL